MKNEQRRKNNFREHGIYLLGWRNGDEPDPSKKVENMTDEEIEKFLDWPERSNAELPLWNDPRC